MKAMATMLALAVAGGANVARAAGEQDEAWIARYIASGKSPGVTISADRVRTIGFDQLAGVVGRRVTVSLGDGRERRGILERVDENGAHLRSQFGTGFFRYTLARADVRDIKLD